MFLLGLGVNQIVDHELPGDPGVVKGLYLDGSAAVDGGTADVGLDGCGGVLQVDAHPDSSCGGRLQPQDQIAYGDIQDAVQGG